MTLREQALAAMREWTEVAKDCDYCIVCEENGCQSHETPHNLEERALDGLLTFLRDNAEAVERASGHGRRDRKPSVVIIDSSVDELCYLLSVNKETP